MMKKHRQSRTESHPSGSRPDSEVQGKMDGEDVLSVKSGFVGLFLPKKNRKLRTNRYILYSSILILILFFCMIAYLAKFIMYDSEDILANSYNKRTPALSEHVKRGDILSADGKILATTTTDDDGNEVRSYPFGSKFAHVVGYTTHGKAGLESVCNYNLLKSHIDIRQQIQNGVQGEKNQGDSVITTLDTSIQEAAYDALGDYNGAVVVIEPSTGRVLAMVSKPDFDTNDLEDIWDDINEDSSNSCLVNRATQGLYPPGSTYKVITALAYMEEYPDTYETFTYDCTGTTKVQSVKIKCYEEEEHGEENLEDAFANSCNTAFVTIGSQLDRNTFATLNEKFLFNQSIDFDLKVKQSQFVLTGASSESQMPQTVIGQGDTLMTPFHNALIMCGIANDGVLMKPYLIDHYESDNGLVFHQAKEEEYKTFMTSSEAAKMKSMLRKVVTDGTGDVLDTDDYYAAGKTGTAENGGKKSHSWFVGYAGETEDQADIVVCALVENSGTGSKYAAPIAKKIFDTYYNK